jgi:hypothetical protein
MQTKAEKDSADLIALLDPTPEELPRLGKTLRRHPGIEQKTAERWAKTLVRALDIQS